MLHLFSYKTVNCGGYNNPHDSTHIFDISNKF